MSGWLKETSVVLTRENVAPRGPAANLNADGKTSKEAGKRRIAGRGEVVVVEHGADVVSAEGPDRQEREHTSVRGRSRDLF